MTGEPPLNVLPIVRPSAPLTREERLLARRLFSEPDEIPEVFKLWLREYLAINPPEFMLSDLERNDRAIRERERERRRAVGPRRSLWRSAKGLMRSQTRHRARKQ